MSIHPAFMVICPRIANIFLFKSRRTFGARTFPKLSWAPVTKQQKPLTFSVKADQSCCWTISSLPPNTFASLYFPDKREALPPLSFPDFSFERQPAHFKYFKWNEFCYADRSCFFFFLLPALIGYLCDSMVFKWCNAGGCQMSCHLITSSIQSSFQNATALSICCY